MKWVLLRRTHVNTNNLDAFRWADGELIMNFTGDPCPYRYEDPDRGLYVKLCHFLGVRPVEVEVSG